MSAYLFPPAGPVNAVSSVETYWRVLDGLPTTADACIGVDIIWKDAKGKIVGEQAGLQGGKITIDEAEYDGLVVTWEAFDPT